MKMNSKKIAEAIYSGSFDKKGQDLSAFMENTVEFLHKKRLIKKSSEILHHLQNIIDKNEGTIRVKVSSPYHLSREEKDELVLNIKHRYNASLVELEETVDEKNIAGIKITAQGEVIDMTISNRLNQLREQLIKN
jgi:ATP synthase F1 delta subunit